MKKDKGKAVTESGEPKGIDQDLISHDCHEEIVVPVCFGEFSYKDAENIRELWEKTWSADSRYSKQSNKNEKGN